MIKLDHTFKFRCGTKECGTRQIMRSLSRIRMTETCGCSDYLINGCKSKYHIFEYKCESCRKEADTESLKKVLINGKNTTFVPPNCNLFHNTFKPLNNDPKSYPLLRRG